MSFCPRVINLNTVCKAQGSGDHIHFYYIIDDSTYLIVAYSNVELGSSYDGVEVFDGDFANARLTERESLMSYYLMKSFGTLKEMSAYLNEQSVGPGRVHYLNGAPTIYGLDVGDFKSLITSTIIGNKLRLEFNYARIEKLKTSFEQDDTEKEDDYTYSNFLMQASQRAVLQLISSLEGSIAVRYPMIDTSVVEGMPCWFVKDEDLFLGSCTAPTITWSVEAGAGTSFSVINLRSIKTCLELLIKPMEQFRYSIELKPFFSAEGIKQSEVLDWRKYCYVEGISLYELFEQKDPSNSKLLDRVSGMTTREFARICVFHYTDYEFNNLSVWKNSDEQWLFSDLSYVDYKYILPRPFFSSKEIVMENVKSINDIYDNYSGEFTSSVTRIDPFKYSGTGDNQIPGKTPKDILMSLKTFIKGVQGLPPYNVNWWDSGVLRTISKVIWE